MQVDSTVALAPPPLLMPTAALLRGFDLAPQAEPSRAAVRPGAPARNAPGRIETRQGFCIGSLNLMIGYADGSELTELPAVYRLPSAPQWLLGMANLHGMLIPVFDLARQFGIDRDAPAKPMLLVLAHGADSTGILIDGLPERLRWDASDIADVATVPEALAAVVQQAVLIGERLWFDLDTTALLAGLEQALIARQ